MIDAVIVVGVLIVSVVIHENAHGWVALALGDQTARRAGRLTLNPIPHIDPVGSVIMPAFLAFASGGQSAFGWAKPVPVDPHNLRGRDRAGFAIVALAGPVSNFVIAFIAALSVRRAFEAGGFVDPGLGLRIAQAALGVNLALAAFNLIPIPPLDGSRLLRLFLRPRGLEILDRIEPYGFVILMLFVFVLQRPFGRVMELITGGLVRLLPL